MRRRSSRRARPKPPTFTNALIAYDVAMGGKQATAAASAASDVADYVLTSEERYKELADSSPR